MERCLSCAYWNPGRTQYEIRQGWAASRGWCVQLRRSTAAGFGCTMYAPIEEDHDEVA